MTRRPALAALVLALAACATEPETVPPWRLVDAPAAADERHLIVTVAAASPGLVAAIAEDLDRAYPIELVAEWPLAAIEAHCYVFRLAPGSAGEAVVARLERDARVRSVQRMRVYASATLPLGSAGEEGPPESANEDLSALQDALVRLRAREAHGVATGRGVRVGVVDTRPDEAHPDLRDAIAAVRDFVETPPGTRTGTRAEAHGTAVAGVIAARAEPARGIVGVAPDASVLALRACWEEDAEADRCTSFSVARALNVAVLEGLDIVNLSIAGPPDPLVDELLAAGAARDMVFVAAAARDPDRSFPASSAHTIAVAGLGEAASVETLRAPGHDVVSTAPGGGFEFYSGSSMATALVSGAAALLRERTPGASPARIAEALRASAPPGASVDVCRAASAIAPTATPCDPRSRGASL
ncbi:MAG: S8 family serine peptidase [Paracoccaceae bacterium]